MLKKLDTTPLYERVYQTIRRALMAGLYPLEQTFSLSQIAEELGTSAMPVRQAVNRLSAEGVLTVLPKRGIQMTHISAEKYRELIRVRVALEGMAAECAARTINDSEIKQLKVLIEATEQNETGPGNWQEFNLLNHDFHFTIYRASQLEVIPPLIEQLWLQTGPLLSIYQKAGPLPNSHRHENILNALKQGDAKQAKDAVRTDIVTGFKFISKAYGWSVDDKILSAVLEP